MLRALVGDKPKQWDKVLFYAEFAFNSTPNHSTGFSPFEVVYCWNIYSQLIRLTLEG
jgi:hypothetical protein